MGAIQRTGRRTVRCPKCNDPDLWWWKEEGAARGKVWTLRSEDGKIIHECAPLTSTVQAPQPIRPQIAAVAMQASEATVWEPTDDLKALIPSRIIADTYIPRRLNGKTDIEVVVKAMQEHQPVLLQGDTGTGKSHLAEACGAMLEWPLVAISGSAGVTVEDFVGFQTLGEKGTQFSYGLLPRLYKGGGILVVDEVNAIPNEIKFALHQAMDWRRSLVLTQNGGEVIRAHPNFGIICCMNPDYSGTQPLNEAFADRFTDGINLYLDYDDSVERRLVSDRRLLLMAGKLRKQFRDQEMMTPTSTRALIGYERNLSLHGEEIARQSFLARYPIEERTAVREVMTLTLDAPSGKAV